ncbi:putative oxidoreductase ZK1290.5 isoform X3 [Lissotriton helveticus]
MTSRVVTKDFRYPTTALANGLRIPMLGLGTSHQGGYSHEAVVYALQKCGIRHIDTAKRYGCESHIKEAIRESGVPRKDLWITTKLWPGDYGYEKTLQACRESCERLGVDYIDLYLMHWPDAHIPGKSSREARAETWRAMEELYDKGICRAIGVSNFLITHLEQLKEDCDIIPHVNQNEVVTIPKSTKPKRIEQNCEVFSFTLTEDDVAMINGMHDGRHVSWDPTNIL